MKTIFAVQKSEYSHCLMKVINYKISKHERQKYYERMKEIEQEVKKLGDKIEIIVTTKNTSDKGAIAPAMIEEDIEKNKHL